jgi:hypothetical protein
MFTRHDRDNPMYTEKGLLLGTKQLIPDPGRFRTNLFDSKTFALNSIFNKGIERGFRPVSNKSMRTRTQDPDREMMASFYAPSELVSPMYQTQKEGFMTQTRFPQHRTPDTGRDPGSSIVKSMQRLRDLSLREDPPQPEYQTLLSCSKMFSTGRTRVRPKKRTGTKQTFIINGFTGAAKSKQVKAPTKNRAGLTVSLGQKRRRVFEAKNRGDWTFKQEGSLPRPPTFARVNI